MNQSIPPILEPVFCCGKAHLTWTSQNNKPWHNPDRELHDRIYGSFLSFAVKRQKIYNFNSRIFNLPPRSRDPPVPQPWVPHDVLSDEAVANNPIKDDTPYCIHVISRDDFGLAYSHRYYAIPKNLNEDWTEISHVHWFAQGYKFRDVVDRWDLKCQIDHETFFRLELRPNLDLRKTVNVVAVLPQRRVCGGMGMGMGGARGGGKGKGNGKGRRR
ncbi:hypothetical protein GLAREA_06032 [Glarea lozoyensis ATCC 20868]|uniref:Uncharacterized protein n=1 Tax=Glarea lozoyensis (strain ATCC 20868 / MF5171) TaxID=1116229 RepID=S3D5G7_GLAL2|nr:uncharacterized protein GLAREA_06032 [Glarea lozoyensis ATCC 20868]EPE33020.1 hypothetical protein GLAREA_06032 [Glarea lozoyensis ATCC 20868]